MFKYIKKVVTNALKSRVFILTAVLFILASILVQRLFNLQIIGGESYLTEFTMSIKKERTLKSTRGEIYDRNGNVLAYNKLAYSVTFEDNGTYGSQDERNLSLNGSLYGLLRVIEDNGNQISMNFRIELDSVGNYYFTEDGINLLRFKADIYGKPYIDDLSDKQKDATADEMMEYLCSAEGYGLLNPEYTETELETYGLPATLTKEETLKLTAMRSAVEANSYKKYVSTTIAADINEETMALIMENKDNYPGVDVIEDSVRVYEDSIYFAPIIGYTGQISEEELDSLNEDNGDYTFADVVGKSGLEQTFETEMQGRKGSETVYVDNLGKVLKQESKVSPQAGNDLYLTLDRDLQIASYKILEQYIAGILYSKIIPAETFDIESLNSTDEIMVSINSVYYALFENNVLDAKHLASADASAVEKEIYESFKAKEAAVFNGIRSELTSSNPVIYSELSKEMQIYMSYIVDGLLMEGTGILNEDAIDKTDATYLAWKNNSISLQEYLTYAISQNWLDITKVDVESTYLDNNEIYNALSDYIAKYLEIDDSFSRKIYNQMIKEKSISGKNICLLLFDQGIIKMNESDYNALSTGSLTAYDFIRSKIKSLEITPAQLALQPCSGSVVITDPDNGDVLACVTYPSYDSNRLANTMDSEYYAKLNKDLSSPFYNKATQEVTAPGSTFKMVTATAGIQEGVIGIDDPVNCVGKFDLLEGEIPINCWIYSEAQKGGSHGLETLIPAIRDSCNYYFNMVGYMLGKVDLGEGVAEEDGEEGNNGYIDSVGIEKLKKYAEMYGFDAPTGIEIGETKPNISDNDAPRSAMGQSKHTYTTSQLSRYVATIANSGTCYDLTLLGKITDSSGNTLDEPDPVTHNILELPPNLWNAIHTGMNDMVNNKDELKELKTEYAFDMAGKTGTAQESEVRANHALFVGYAPYQNPEIAIAVRITNGYSSTNAACVARDIIKYRFGLVREDELITGEAIVVEAKATTNIRAD